MSEKMFNPTEYKPPIYKLMNNNLVEWEYAKIGELYCWTILNIRDENLLKEKINKFNINNRIYFNVIINRDSFNMLSQDINFRKDKYYLTLNSKKGKDYEDDLSNIGHNYEYDFNNLKLLIDYVNQNIVKIDKEENKKICDDVNRPNHYQLNIKDNNIQVIDIIDEIVKDYTPQEAFKIANVIKYVLRAGKKNGKEDLRKARKYIEMLLEGDNEQ